MPSGRDGGVVSPLIGYCTNQLIPLTVPHGPHHQRPSRNARFPVEAASSFVALLLRFVSSNAF